MRTIFIWFIVCMLVEKGISIHKYHAVLNSGIALFFSLTLLIPLCALMHYVVLEKSDLRWNSWSNSLMASFPVGKGGSKNKISPQDGLLENSFIALDKERVCTVPLPELASLMVVLEHRPRPDQVNAKKSILLEIEGSGQKRLVFNQERVFIECKNEKEFFFSNVETPFWFEPNILDNGEVELALHLDFKGVNHEILYEVVQNIKLMKRQDFGALSKDEKEIFVPIIDYMRGLSISEADILIEMYGGESFDFIKGSYRMCCGNIMNPFYVKAGDLFVWRNGQLEEGKGDTLGLPLLMVNSLNQEKCEFILWDSEGVHCNVVSIPVSKAQPPLVKPQELFLKVHQRTDASVTCQLYKHNVILRKGDWLLHSNGRFRNLRSFDEVKDYLRYALKGELFIFDGLVKKDGIMTFVGHLFNEERTQAKKFEFPLTEKKKTIPLKKKEAKVVPTQVKDE